MEPTPSDFGQPIEYGSSSAAHAGDLQSLAVAAENLAVASHALAQQLAVATSAEPLTNSPLDVHAKDASTPADASSALGEAQSSFGTGASASLTPVSDALYTIALVNSAVALTHGPQNCCPAPDPTRNLPDASTQMDASASAEV